MKLEGVHMGKKKDISLSLAVETSSTHPGYSANLSAEENVDRGRMKAHSYKRVYKELNALANLTHKERFREAADLAYKRAMSHDEFKSERKRKARA
jgi:hypothetical protein